MALKRSQPGVIKVNASVLDCRNITIQHDVSVRQMSHSGLEQPTNVMVDGVGPVMINADMALKTALNTYGLAVNEYDTAGSDTIAAVLQDMVGASGSTAATNTQQDSAYRSSAILSSWTVQEGQSATATVMHYCWSVDGDASPLSTSLVSMPSLTAIPEDHGIGTLTINGTAIPGVTGFSYAANFNPTIQRVDGGKYAIGCVRPAMSPQITVTSADPVGLQAALTEIGTKITSGAVITLKKFANDSLSSTGQITITAASGFVAPQSYQGQDGSLVTGGCVIYASSSDGSTPGFVVS